MTLEMFMEEEFVPLTDGHIEAMKLSWKKMDKTHKLFQFNHDCYTRFFQNTNDKYLLYYASLGVPHYSNWAADVAIARGI
jgi:hypothetical protein